MATTYPTPQQWVAMSSDEALNAMNQIRGSTPNNRLPWEDPPDFDSSYLRPGSRFTQQQWNTLIACMKVQFATQNWADPSNFQMAPAAANEIIRQLFFPAGAKANADLLCRSGIAYPKAIEIARQIDAGTGRADRLVGGDINGPTATALANAITLCRSGTIPAGLKPYGS